MGKRGEEGRGGGERKGEEGERKGRGRGEEGGWGWRSREGREKLPGKVWCCVGS